MGDWTSGDDFVIERDGREYVVFVSMQRVGVKIIEGGREYVATFPHRGMRMVGGGVGSPMISHRMAEARNVAADALGECDLSRRM